MSLGQKTTSRSQLSSTMWSLETKLKSSDLVAVAFNVDPFHLPYFFMLINLVPFALFACIMFSFQIAFTKKEHCSLITDVTYFVISLIKLWNWSTLRTEVKVCAKEIKLAIFISFHYQLKTMHEFYGTVQLPTPATLSTERRDVVDPRTTPVQRSLHDLSFIVSRAIKISAFVQLNLLISLY